ncbi:MAG: ComEC/Rec2 family competence protein, partial [Phycisphaerae bacterium]
ALLEAVGALRRLVDGVIFRHPFGDQDREIAADMIRASSPFRWRLRQAAWWFLVVFPAVSVGAWLAGVPVVALHFNRIQPWGPVSSVIVFPLMYVVMVLAFMKILVSSAFPVLGFVIAEPLAVVDRFLIWVVEGLSSLPGASMTIAAPPWWVVVLYYVWLLLFVWRFRRRPRESQRDSQPSERNVLTPQRWLSRVCGVAFVLLVLCGAVWQCLKDRSDRLVVTVLSVGAGSVTVIELPDGQTVLYDAGSMSPYDIGRNTVVPFLRHRGITRIDRVHLSHPNLDHVSGLPSVLEEIETGPIVINEHFEPRSPPRSPGRHLLEILARREHPIETLDPAVTRWERGGVMFELLSPRDDFDGKASTNDTSTVLRLTYAGHSILLTGDIEEHTQRALLQRGDLGADVLVLPHHGGVERSSKAFLEAVAPSAVIRSSHERMEETYNGLQEVVGAMPLHNTADVGAVGVVIDAEGVRVSSMVVVALLLPVDVLVVELDPPGQYLFQQFSWR